jgi:hypothetical protein
MALVNVLYSKKLYYPLVTLLGLMIEEIATIQIDFYQEAPNHQKTECFLHLYEFLLFMQCYILIILKNYDRALYQLIRLQTPINKMNQFIHKILLGICMGHCLHYDLAVTTLCEAYYLIEELLSQYESSKDDFKKENEPQKKKVSPESIFY